MPGVRGYRDGESVARESRNNANRADCSSRLYGCHEAGRTGLSMRELRRVREAVGTLPFFSLQRAISACAQC
jgi:hypothetical protein